MCNYMQMLSYLSLSAICPFIHNNASFGIMHWILYMYITGVDNNNNNNNK